MKQPEIGTILIATDVCEISLGHNVLRIYAVQPKTLFETQNLKIYENFN